VTRASGQVMRRVATYLTPELSKRLEWFCVQNDQDMSEVIAKAAEQYLKALGH
jgi:hypothetical protein